VPRVRHPDAVVRLDRFLSNLPTLNRQQARLCLSRGEVQVNGLSVRDPLLDVRGFDRIELNGQLLQAGRPARYFMLNKPQGCVSATRDPRHRTVLDLLDAADREELHIAGRLDYNSTGLILLSNDGLWSRRLTQPVSEIAKTYRVETEQPITEQMRERFAEGLYFRFEDLVTRPAQLEILSSHSARLSIHEGRYHQIKRMFGQFGNKVLALHRERMGPYRLDPQLAPGAYRALSCEEVALI
jgi:16S rRNA pseudouridine516 synthase